jgi:hypothetical protein
MKTQVQSPRAEMPSVPTGLNVRRDPGTGRTYPEALYFPSNQLPDFALWPANVSQLSESEPVVMPTLIL